jgi:hypothetical protein
MPATLSTGPNSRTANMLGERPTGCTGDGMAHPQLGEQELARQRLTAALEIRERLGHGRVEETRSALELC